MSWGPLPIGLKVSALGGVNTISGRQFFFVFPIFMRAGGCSQGSSGDSAWPSALMVPPSWYFPLTQSQNSLQFLVL